MIVVQSSVVNEVYNTAIYNDLERKVHPQAAEAQYWASSAQSANTLAERMSDKPFSFLWIIHPQPLVWEAAEEAVDQEEVLVEVSLSVGSQHYHS
jgi:hypothetical protein